MESRAELEYCAFFNEGKHTEYNFLSNFYLHPLVDDLLGKFKCSEGLYQYLKFSYLDDHSLLAQFQQADGQIAYDMSRQLKDKIDPLWNREAAMRHTLSVKFSDDELRRKLLATKSAYLVENSPNGHDQFWADNGNGTGKNMLGIFLMERRQALGGVGVVEKPPILDLFYSRKCDHCTNCSHFTNKGMFYNYCDAHMTHELKLGNYTRQIHLSDIPDGTGRFLYFKTNDDDQLIAEGTRLIAEHIQSLGLKNPFFVTPEASTIAIAHDLRTKYGIDGVVIGKSKKPTDIETFSIEYCAITSTDKKKLYLEKNIAKKLADKDIIIIDNVCTTGETLRAVYGLLMNAGVHCDQINEALVLFTEGNDTNKLIISDNVELKLHRFCHLPLFPTDPSVDQSRYRLYSAATIPTTHGQCTFAVYHDRTGAEAQNAIAFYPPKTFDNGRDEIVVRIHDACATSELFDSVKCDCKRQLDYAKEYIGEHGGMIIYLNQEGRGIGLGNKIKAYELQQEKGLNTVDANRALGLPDDLRMYIAARDILTSLGVTSIRLMSNNPRKVDELTKLGIKVTGTIPCVVEPVSSEMQNYMRTKAEKMGHTIPTARLAYQFFPAKVEVEQKMNVSKNTI